MRVRTFLLAALLLGCSGESFEITPAAVSDATTDSAVADTATTPPPKDSSAPDTMTAADTAKPDSATTPDTARLDVGTDGCTSAADCKKFSSYCDSAPCQCLPLKSTEAAPKCEGSTVTCFIDPCTGKTADCVAGVCVVK